MKETTLYPLKFAPIFKETIWGGEKLKKTLGKDAKPGTGESWEISGVPGNRSVVSNGFLKGNNLEELIEIYMGEIVGEKVFKQFGTLFPLLIKFIDAKAQLSIQVHPDDKMAKERHESFGKTEMWYVIEADNNAELIVGFNQPIDKKKYIDELKKGHIEQILNREPVQPGDVFFLPAGRIHAIGAGILLAEIQQTSDVTYRIYDWNRTDADGNQRELHTDLAVDAIDYKTTEDFRTHYQETLNESVKLVQSPYFETKILEFNAPIQKDSYAIDSFIIYMCMDGKAKIEHPGGTESIQMGETILLPAAINTFKLIPDPQCKLLDVHIPQN